MFMFFFEQYPDYTNFEEHRVLYSNVIREYKYINPEFLTEFSPVEAVDITEQLKNRTPGVLDTVNSNKSIRLVSVVIKNGIFSLQYNAETWFHFCHGIPILGFGAYSGKTLEDYKGELARSGMNYNSPDLDTPYDGTNDIFYRQIIYTRE